MTMSTRPQRLTAPFDPAPVLSLIREAFAYMDGVIDPPSSLHRMSPADVLAHAATGEVWVVGAPPVACMFLTLQPEALYVGRLAVAAGSRGRGFARILIATAEARARALGLPWLELQSRIELTANHAAFAALGFSETGRTAHPGYDRPTSLTFRRAVAAGTGDTP